MKLYSLSKVFFVALHLLNFLAKHFGASLVSLIWVKYQPWKHWTWLPVCLPCVLSTGFSAATSAAVISALGIQASILRKNQSHHRPEILSFQVLKNTNFAPHLGWEKKYVLFFIGWFKRLWLYYIISSFFVFWTHDEDTPSHVGSLSSKTLRWLLAVMLPLYLFAVQPAWDERKGSREPFVEL